MHARHLAVLFAIGIALAGCAKRWEPEQGPGPLKFVKACPGRKAPTVADFGPKGVSAAYHFVVTGASEKEIAALIDRSEKAGLEVHLASRMIVLNGTDALFASSKAPLLDQPAVDAEFATICAIKVRSTHLTNVEYNRVGIEDEWIRIR
ncbi:hypothetical protein [Sphingopyxis sp. LC363]|uniref:hypothetical protein n=1 Tax=Sphingopyxis sp. LC363 TaxID=1120705 RepID=UPI00050FDE2E|nr:hypothetical protein [Sphingopyxis sp. LC363]KGB58270.1 hypothetical protein FG95_01305 [Sphingopyxis sp. LC363]